MISAVEETDALLRKAGIAEGEEVYFHVKDNKLVVQGLHVPGAGACTESERLARALPHSQGGAAARETAAQQCSGTDDDCAARVGHGDDGGTDDDDGVLAQEAPAAGCVAEALHAVQQQQSLQRTHGPCPCPY